MVDIFAIFSQEKVGLPEQPEPWVSMLESGNFFKETTMI
jgi:hypothetical protein